MKELFFILLITNYSLQVVNAQEKSIVQFQRAIGGEGVDYAYSVKPTTDGGFAAAGGTTSFGGGDFYVIKLDAAGNMQWNKTVGGTGYDAAYFIVQTSDGGYAVAGETSSFGAGGPDMFIVKLNSSGGLQWSKTVGGTNEDVALAIVQTSDGGYAVAGYTYSFGAGSRDYYIVKLDAGGTLQWSKTAGGTNYDFAETLIQSSDGGCAVAGFTYSFGAGGGDFLIVKLDAGGNSQWNRTIGGTQDDYCLSIIQSTDGGYATAGPSSSFGAGNNDFYIVKLTSSGSIQWTRTVGGPGLDYAESIIQSTDGGYTVAGLTFSFGSGNKDMFVVKLDSVGTFKWNRTMGGIGDDYAESIVQAADGGYVGAGHTSSYGAGNYDAYFVKLDGSGNSCRDTTTPQSITSSGGTSGNPTVTITSPTSTVTTPAPTTGTGGTFTVICNYVGIQPISAEIPEQFSLFQNYPNPFNPTTNISFSIPQKSYVKIIIYDASGREVDELVNFELNTGTYKVDWPAPSGNANKFASGIYFYKFIASSYTKSKRMVLLK